MMNEDEIKEIEKYLLKELSEHELIDFQAKLNENPELQEKVHFMGKLMAAVQGVGDEEFIRKIEEAEKKFAKEIELKHFQKRKPISISRQWFTVAASILILVSLSLVMYYSVTRDQRMFDQYFNAPENTFVDYTRGSIVPEQYSHMSTDQYNLSIRAVKLYERQQYKEAARLLKENVEKIPQNIDFIFIEAISCMELNETQVAIDLLNYINTIDKSQQFAGNWFLALAYVKSGDHDKALRNAQIVVRSGGVHSKDAQELINKLSN